MIRHPLGRLALLSTFAFLAACGSSDDEPATPGGNPPPSPPPPSFSLALSIDKAVILQGTSVPVTVTVTREAGFTGAVTLAGGALPAGVATAAAVVPAGATSAVMSLAATVVAPHSLPTASQIKGSAGTLEKTAALTVTVRGTPGAVDTSFAAGKLTSAFSAVDDYARAMAAQADGKLVVVGHTTVTGSGSDFAVARYTRDGELDPGFGTGGKLTTAIAPGTRGDQAQAVAVDAQGRVLVAGYSDSVATGVDFALVRYLADGRLDTAFGTGGKVITSFGNDADRAFAILVQPDGKIVLGGESNQGATTSGQDFALARYDTDGNLDTTFGIGGKVLTAISAAGGRDIVHALARQVVGGQERIVAVGGESDFVVARYLPDGRLDPAFGNGGTLLGLFQSTIGSANAVAVADDGKLVVAGHRSHDFAILKLNLDGSLDTTFGNGGRLVRPASTTDWDDATAVAVQVDGKIVVGGWAFADTGPGYSQFVLQRYSAAGVPDDDFGTGGSVATAVSPTGRNSAGRALLLQADPRVPTVRAVLAGEAANGANDFGLVRYWL